MADVFQAFANSMAEGSFKPLLGLFSGGSATYGLEKAADYVAENRNAVIAIRGALRSEAGLKVSGNAIARTADRTSKALWAVGAALSAKAGYDAYKTCTDN
jgi:hypothetical protein